MGFVAWLRSLFSEERIFYKRLEPPTQEEKEEPKQEGEVKYFPQSKDGYFIQFRGELFLFDEEGIKKFKEEFYISPYKLSIEYKKNYFYLVRVYPNGYIEYFHSWFMMPEKEEFREKNHLDKWDVVVHHKKVNPWNNRRENLQVMTRTEHDILHHRQTTIA